MLMQRRSLNTFFFWQTIACGCMIYHAASLNGMSIDLLISAVSSLSEPELSIIEKRIQKATSVTAQSLASLNVSLQPVPIDDIAQQLILLQRKVIVLPSKETPSKKSRRILLRKKQQQQLKPKNGMIKLEKAKKSVSFSCKPNHATANTRS